jgi:glycosyltransferase involved in cell wall biosynthesis
LVSVVVIQPGLADLRALARRLDRTTYRPIELVLAADQVSDMGGDPDPSIPVRFVRPAPDGDSTVSINAAIEAAAGELICLLDPEVEPILPDWLGHLVETVLAGSAGAGPVLLRARGQGLVRAKQQSADLSVLSVGIDLERAAGVIRPAHMAFGRRYRWDRSLTTQDVPALSLACIVVRRLDILRAGGLPPGYGSSGRYSAEVPYLDADLGSSLRIAGGHLTNDRRVLAWCPFDEPSSPLPAPPPERRDPRDTWVTRGDAAVFLDRWGPRLARQVLVDVVSDEHHWSTSPLSIATVGAVRLGMRPGRRSWRVASVPSAKGSPRMRAIRADVVVVASPHIDIRETPSGVIRVAWIKGAIPDHLDEFDLVIAQTPADRARVSTETIKDVAVADLEGPQGQERLRRLLLPWAEARRLSIRIGAANVKTAHLWGDFHFARSLQRYLERAGHPTRVRLLGDWSSAGAASDDATIHLLGNQVAHNRPSQLNVLWQISHPDLATGELYDTYDQAFVASDRFAASMATRTSVPVAPLHQATDPERFYPDATGPRHDLLFVANYRPNRPVVEWLIPTDRDLAIYGKGWDEHGLEPRYHRGPHIANADLRRYYSSASIVLNDTWEDMRAAGFISNRIYDALACGAFVLSDAVDGLVEEFDGGVAIYEDELDLRAAVERYLEEGTSRREIAEQGRAAVLARHTFGQRAAAILEVLHPRLDERPPMVTDSPPP